MPIYEYQCQKCQKETGDLLVKLNTPPPKCCKKEMERKISRGGSFRLKGHGWAIDGYARSDN